MIINLQSILKPSNSFSKNSLQKYQDRNYKYIHIGLVHVGIKPFGKKKGLNIFILAVLRDAKFQNFQDSLLSSVSFDYYSNSTISLKDKNIL